MFFFWGGVCKGSSHFSSQSSREFMMFWRALKAGTGSELAGVISSIICLVSKRVEISTGDFLTEQQQGSEN